MNLTSLNISYKIKIYAEDMSSKIFQMLKLY